MLREAIPKAKRIAVLVNPANPSHLVAVQGAEDAARGLDGLQLEVIEYRGRDDLVAAFQAARWKRADGLIALDDSVTFSYRATIAELAAKNRLPALHGYRKAAEELVINLKAAKDLGLTIPRSLLLQADQVIK